MSANHHVVITAIQMFIYIDMRSLHTEDSAHCNRGNDHSNHVYGVPNTETNRHQTPLKQIEMSKSFTSVFL